MKNLFLIIRHFLSVQFNLQGDKADELTIVENVRNNTEFKGVNLWALIFAILIASIGLNVNSTAVVIGAMLISPIMGPVMGIGLGVGINDLSLVKKGARNLLIASIIGILASALYFWVTPLHDAKSELLARTSPSIWDVFIAFFGGCAGMVAASRTEKSNVIPGVAIATALIPPLCTAGFGLATNNWLYFFGAIYLYFINSVFIAIATYLISRYLKMKRHRFGDTENKKKAITYIILIAIITTIPSIILAYRIVQKSIFEASAQKFVDEQFNYPNTQVVSKRYQYKSGSEKLIEVLLIGNQLGVKTIDSLKGNLKKYNLQDVQLVVRQGLDARHQVDLSQIRASILEDVFNKIPKPDTVKTQAGEGTAIDSAVFRELKALYPDVKSFGTNQMIVQRTDTTKWDTLKIAYVSFKKRIEKNDEFKLQNWLRARYQSATLKLVVQ
ncbi:MAG TPA: TIGR00341 family protein [Mucilaginibacter sp.]|nr:TIGR00341 family protein [Mucilaginibacter sp.]